MQILAVLDLLIIGISVWVGDTPYPYTPAWTRMLLNSKEWGYLENFLPLLGVSVLLWLAFRFSRAKSYGMSFFASKLCVSFVVSYFILCGVWDADLLIKRLYGGPAFQGSLGDDLAKMVWLVLIQIGIYIISKIILIYSL